MEDLCVKRVPAQWERGEKTESQKQKPCRDKRATPAKDILTIFQKEGKRPFHNLAKENMFCLLCGPTIIP